MNAIEISRIIIPSDRQRKTFDDEAINEIKESIIEHGLFHALLVAPDKRTLVAGESRYRALNALPENFQIKYDGEVLAPNHVPFSITSTEDPVAIFEIELHENIKRRDLPWRERAAAIAKLHKLRTSQHGEWDPKDNPSGWSLRKTAGEVNPTAKTTGGQHVKKVQEDLELANAMDDPAIARIRDRKAALKVLQKKRDQQDKAIAAISAKKVQAEDFIFKIGNCVELIRELPDNSIDIVLSDPPYGMNFHKDKQWSGLSRDYDDSPEAYQKTMHEFIEALEPKLKPQAHIYLFCDLRHFLWLDSEITFMLGIDVWRHPIVWDKGSHGSYPNINLGPRHCYDVILYANKGKKEVLSHDIDIIRGVRVLDDKTHPDQKPPELFKNLLARSATPGDQILDPFAGAGTTFLAAAGKELRVTCFELDKQWEPFLEVNASAAATTEPEVL